MKPTIKLSESYIQASETESLQDISLGDLLRQVTGEIPQQVAIKEAGSDKHWNYQQLLADAELTAYALLNLYQPGDRVAVYAANSAQWVILQFGAALAGITLVTLNPANRQHELLYLLTQSRAQGLFLTRQFRDLDNVEMINDLREELPQLKQLHYLEDWDNFLTENAKPTALPKVSPQSPALVVYTSGTTGKPKGAVLTHIGIVNNARFSSQRCEVKTGSVWLNTLPMFHIGGSITMTLGCLANRSTQVILPGFDPELMLRSIHEDRVTITMAVPTMLIALFEHPLFVQTDFSGLEVLVTGGTTIPKEIITETKSKMGVDVEVIFGQTEAGGVMTQSARQDTEEHICSTVGTPMSSYNMKIIDPETGVIQPISTVGEICVNSPCTMLEYFEMPDKTAETIDDEGWIHTGDLGMIASDGYLQITGRLKDMIIRGGENIYPREIEDQLITHNDIAEVAVFGAPDPKWGERVVAAVRLEQGQQLDAESLQEYLTTRIAKHKIPKDWMEVTTFPINASGKIQKFLLAEQFGTQ